MEDKNFKEEILQLKKIIASTPGNVYWKDRSGKYLGCNEEFAHLNKLTSADIIGKTDFDLLPNEKAIIIASIDNEIITTNSTREIEEPGFDSEGKEAIYLSKKIPLHDQAGVVTGLLGISINITARKKMEQELLAAKEKAELANKAKTEFLENMRHDIRTPLTGIIGFATILRDEAIDPKTKECGDNLVASGEALLIFLNEILETIRITTGEIPLFKKKFNLKQKLEDVIHLNQALAKQKDLELQFEYDENLPDYFMGDPKRIHRISLELITNALTFTNKGHVKLSISMIKNENKQVIIKLAVEDTGIGIPADQHEEIFTRFKRLTPSFEGTYKGAGLGLAVIKQFIDDLDGEIYVESQLNSGTTFTCIIPLKESLLDDALGADTSQEPPINNQMTEIFSSLPNTNIDSSAKNLSYILLVEDTLIVQKTVTHMLTKLNCRVDVAPNGETALQLVKQHNYDLIFMDIGLPDMDGLQVTKRIRMQEFDKEYGVPIIALTAHVDEENKQKCIEAGMNAVFPKPLAEKTASDMLCAFIPTRSKQSSKQTSPQGEIEIKLFELPSEIINYEEALETVGGNKEFLEEILVMFIDSLPEELKGLQEAHDDKNWKNLQSLAHKLKGSSLYCGLNRLKTACSNLDSYLRTGETELSDKLYQQVIDEAETFKQHYLKMNSKE